MFMPLASRRSTTSVISRHEIIKKGNSSVTVANCVYIVDIELNTLTK